MRGRAGAGAAAERRRPGRSRRGGRRAPRRASRSSAVGCSSRWSSASSSRRATVSRAPSPTSIAPSSRSSRPSAGTPTTRSGCKAAYPIHPEVFDRLYTDWSTLVKFQRTRGVLRLMAAVIHSLWEKGDRNPLIMPANIPIDDPRVAVRADALPLGQLGADHREGRRRAERAAAADRRRGAEPRQVRRDAGAWRARIYLGSAPTASAANRGIEDRRIKLGCVMPGESPAVFGDALRRLAVAATYLYQDGAALLVLHPADRHQARRGPGRAAQARSRRGRRRSSTSGCAPTCARPATFAASTRCRGRAQTCPTTWTRGWSCWATEYPYSKDAGNRPRPRPQAILRDAAATRPRLFQNTLVFLAVDQARLQDLDEAVRRYLAWTSILDEKEDAEPRPAPGPPGRDPDRSRPTALWWRACPRPTNGSWCRCRPRRRRRFSGRPTD